jgi:excisionase family DNA binding protein
MSTECKTLSVPRAGKLYFDLSRNASYDAVKRGQIPVVKIGRKYRVPVAAMERLLDSAAPKPTP